MMKNLLFFLLVTLSLPLFASKETDSLLLQLEWHMTQRQFYDAEKNERIARIKDLIKDKNTTPADLFEFTSQLIEEYHSYVFDSALFYLDKNLQLSRVHKNMDWEIETKIHTANLLASSGRYKDAVDMLQSIPHGKIPQNQISNYYLAFQNVYSILTFYTPVTDNRIIYNKLYLNYVDTALSVLDKESDQYMDIKETQLRDKRLMDECIKINTRRMTKVKMGQRNYSLIMFERALDFGLTGDVEQQKKYLILSAISDIKGSVKDNASMTDLAKLLYKENELMKAYNYINFSYADATMYNSSLRFAQISGVLPIINEAYQLKSTRQRNALRLFLLIISILSIGLLILTATTYKQMKKISSAQEALKDVNIRLRLLNNELNEANSKLNESNKVKEHYIGNFLTICSTYIDKLDNYRKMVGKHLQNREYAELTNKIKSLELIEDETREFYDNFDTIFLHIFPDFVERMNELLVESEQFELKNGEHLNTELRIFALIRLGITDSNQIATLLRYSIRTIYNYRAKIRNSAKVPREEFEEQIMKIGAFIEKR
jgi:hypothetical protein